jgi:hypothetical protein
MAGASVRADSADGRRKHPSLPFILAADRGRTRCAKPHARWAPQAGLRQRPRWRRILSATAVQYRDSREAAPDRARGPGLPDVVLLQGPHEGAESPAAELGAPGQELTKRPRQGQDELPDGDGRDYRVHEGRGRVAGASSGGRGRGRIRSRIRLRLRARIRLRLGARIRPRAIPLRPAPLPRHRPSGSAVGIGGAGGAESSLDRRLRPGSATPVALRLAPGRSGSA